MKERLIVTNTAENYEPRINGIRNGSLRRTIHKITSQPELGKFRFRVRNQWINAGRTRSTIKDYYGWGRERDERKRPVVIDTDMPAIFDGGNSAINPLECLLSAVGACLTSTLIYQATHHGIDADAIQCYAEGFIDIGGNLGVESGDQNGFERIEIQVKIEADAPVDEIDELLKISIALSPIVSMLSRATDVRILKV